MEGVLRWANHGFSEMVLRSCFTNPPLSFATERNTDHRKTLQLLRQVMTLAATEEWGG